MRTLTRQLAATAQKISAVFAMRDFATIATAINRGVAEAKFSMIKFQRAVTAKVIHEVDQVIKRVFPAPAPAPAPAAVEALTAKSAAESARSGRSRGIGAGGCRIERGSNGKTDLTNGNKVVPGVPPTGSDVPGQGAQTA